MPHLKCNGDATIENAVKKIDYPEHKLKHKEGIVLKDFKKNVKFIGKSQEFYQEMEAWKDDRYTLNYDRKHHKNRQKSDEEFLEYINKKGIATTYTLQENSLFFKQKFNDDPKKIQEFYELFLECFLEEAGIPKDKVINAIIHFDQTNPHLHFAISNIHEKYSKEHQRMVKTVNKEKYHLFEHLKENKRQNPEDWARWQEFRNIREQYYNHEISASDWQAHLDKNYNVGILSSVIERFNKRYEEKYGNGLYLNREDYIYMHDIRGFTNKDILRISEKRAQTEKYIKMQNNVILKSRETAYNSELFNFKYKKYPTIDEKKIKEYEETLFSNKDDKLFKEYVRSKYNKLFSDFVIQMNKEFSNEQKANFCSFLKINWKHEQQIGFLKAISSINELYQLREIAERTRNTLDIWVDDKVKIQNMDDVKDIALCHSFVEWFTKTNYDLLKDIALEVKHLENQKEVNTKSLWMIANKTFNRLDKTLNELENNLDIYNKLQKNWYFKYESNQMQKRFEQLYNVELNKLDPKQVQLELSSYEQKLMFKKVLQERIDFDLKTLNLYESFKAKGLNNIERMREYNKILSYCACIQYEVKQQWEIAKDFIKDSKDKILEISNKDPRHLDNKDQIMLDQCQEMYDIYKLGADFTPQTLAQRIYERTWVPLDYEQELKNISPNLSEEEKQIEITKIENLKEIEYAILNTGLTFNDLKKEFQIEKEMNEQLKDYDFKKYEEQYLEEYIEDFQNKLKMDSRTLAYEAKELNNWFSIENLREDLELEPSRNWEDLELEELINTFKQNGIQLEELSESQKFDTAGINIDFINQLNEELTLNFIKTNSYKNQEQELARNNYWNDLDLDEPTISEKYAPFFANNEKELAEISKNAKQWVLEVKLNHIVALAKKGYDIDELCKEIDVDPKRVRYQIHRAKELKMERDEHIVEMTLGKK